MKIIALIPAYNEEKEIDRVISGTKKYVDEVIVIDDGSQDKTEVQSETTGVVISNPQLSSTEFQQLFPDGEISKEIVKIFFIESELSFTVKNGYTLNIYKSSVSLGKYRIKFITRNMVIPNVVIAFGVSGR